MALCELVNLFFPFCKHFIKNEPGSLEFASLQKVLGLPSQAIIKARLREAR